VVDAAVKAAKGDRRREASGLVNAVLRRYLRERKTLDATSRATQCSGMRRRFGCAIVSAPIGPYVGPNCWRG